MEVPFIHSGSGSFDFCSAVHSDSPQLGTFSQCNNSTFVRQGCSASVIHVCVALAAVLTLHLTERSINEVGMSTDVCASNLLSVVCVTMYILYSVHMHMRIAPAAGYGWYRSATAEYTRQHDMISGEKAGGSVIATVLLLGSQVL